MIPAVALLAGAPWATADDVQLAGGGKLSGRVLSISENGALLLESPHTVEPLALKGDGVRRVDFSPPEEIPAAADARLELRNGDVLPVIVLGYSPERGLDVRSESIGELTVPRGYLHSLSLGVRPATVIYRGPDDLANWTTDRRGGANWTLQGERMVVDGTGQIGRMLNPPDQHTIRLTLSWNGQPNFQLSFCDPLEEHGQRVDRYFLQFANAGMEIKRESSEGPRRYNTVGILNRTPDQFRHRRMEIEIRVDRRESVLHLLIDGEPEGRFMDPFGNTPTAGGILLVSNAAAGNVQEVRNLTVESWDQKETRHRVEDRGDATRDALVMRQGDRFSGHLASAQSIGGELVFSFRSNFQDRPLEVPAGEVSTMFFAADGEAGEVAVEDAGFVLRFHDQGSLAVTQSSFAPERVTASHPLLGELSLPRTAISALERRASTTTTKDPIE